jgi:hypothetical protein
MGFLDWFKRDRKITDYSPEELKREEGRLKIRERQMVARLDKCEGEREAIFRRGFEVKSSVRRRILAGKFEEREQELRRIEKDLVRQMKESMAVSAIRYRLERRAAGDSSLLKKMGGSEIETLAELCEDDSIAEDIFAEKLTEVLGVVAEPEGDPLSGMGQGAKSVISLWERMDEGDIGSVEDGLAEAEERAERGLTDPDRSS